MAEPRIVVDSRESVAAPKIVSGLRDMGVKVRVELLEAGDYYILGEKPVLVERKHVTDLVGSVRTRRLWSELDAVKRAEAEPLLLVEGSLAEDLSREKKAKVYPLRVKEKATRPEDYARIVVEGLPNVSGQRAINLLKHFGTVRNIANASVEELAEVEGIGRKIAERIYETFNLKWEEASE